MKKIVTTAIIMLMFVGFIPTEVHAASVSAPAQVKNLKAGNIKATSVKLTWSKIAKNKNTKGYAIYRNGKFIKRISYKTNVFTDAGLKAGTRYSYIVRAYNTYKQKQWYNKKTKKWQTKAPAKRYRGRTRYVTAYKYGKTSASRVITTAPVVKEIVNLSLSGSGSNLIIKWTCSSRNIKNMTFTVYRNNTKIGTSKTGTYTDSVTASGRYTYYVSAQPSAAEKLTSKKLYADYTANPDALFDGSSMSNITLNVGQTHKFVLSTRKTITWSSSNSNIATVSSGRVTANASGTTVITATNWNGEKKSATVTVKAPGETQNPTNESSEMVTVYDYQNIPRRVKKGSADYYNPEYNRNIDGEFTVDTYSYGRLRFVQRNKITIQY